MFVVSCVVLGLMGVAQILTASMALAVRFEKSTKVRIVEKEVERIVPIRVEIPVAEEVVERQMPVLPPVPDATQVEMPAIADPLSERLVTEARGARIAGDMGRAIVKLEEALQESPGDPTVLYELGLIHETMGVYDKASAYYELVFQQGMAGAGELYQSAAEKLRDGFAQPIDMLGKLALGRVRIFNDPRVSEGQRVILTVPVQKAPGEEIESNDIEVAITFFNKSTKGEILQLEEDSWAVPQWISLPFDWDAGEENLRMTYVIPPRDRQTEHLFGELFYYGQVVTLSYQGEVLDVQAWPRDLAARIGQNNSIGGTGRDFPEFLDQDILPPDFDPEIPLLNPLLPE